MSPARDDDADPTEPEVPGDGTSDAESSSASGRPRRRTGEARTGWGRGVALMVVLSAAAAAGVWGLTQGSRDPDPFADARDVAREFGAAYLSFDGRDASVLGERLLELGTDDFVREYESARLPGIEALFSGGDVSTRAEVTDVFTTGIDDDRVRAVVFLDVAARGPEGVQRLRNLSFVLELQADDDGWLVDAVAPLPVPEVVGDGVASSTTTTAPGATTTVPAPSTAPPPTTAG